MLSVLKLHFFLFRDSFDTTHETSRTLYDHWWFYKILSGVVSGLKHCVHRVKEKELSSVPGKIYQLIVTPPKYKSVKYRYSISIKLNSPEQSTVHTYSTRTKLITYKQNQAPNNKNTAPEASSAEVSCMVRLAHCYIRCSHIKINLQV